MIGAIGLLGVLVMNLAEWILMDVPAAEPFSDGWWTGWLPGYAFLSVFLLVGLAGRRAAGGNKLFVEEVEGAATASQPDPVSQQLVFDRVFKIYVDRYGKETTAQIMQAIRAVLRSADEALLLFERCESLGNDARHFMRRKVFGHMSMPDVRKELMLSLIHI